jgi:dynein heavy chain
MLHDSHVLDLATLAWLPDAAPPLPSEVCNNVCEGVPSVPHHKVFSFGGKAGMMSYLNTVDVMDCGSQTWSAPAVVDAVKAPCGRYVRVWQAGVGCLTACCCVTPCSLEPPAHTHTCTHTRTCREDTAWAYDAKTSSFFIFGGWASRWLGDLVQLDVSAIIGPPYACTGDQARPALSVCACLPAAAADV